MCIKDLLSSQEMLSGSSQGRHLCSHSFSRVEGSVCPTPATALDRELPACPRGAAPSGGPETSFNIEMGSSRKAKLHQAKEGCVTAVSRNATEDGLRWTTGCSPQHISTPGLFSSHIIWAGASRPQKGLRAPPNTSRTHTEPPRPSRDTAE